LTVGLAETLVSSDELLAKRADIARRLAPFRALYGNGSYAGERQFKLVEARCATAIRAQWEVAGEKVTEPKLDAAVRQHPEYIQALTDDVKRRAEWIALEEELNELEWRLRVRQSDASLLSAEARLTVGAA
jgi:hypothetical protein